MFEPHGAPLLLPSISASQRRQGRIFEQRSGEGWLQGLKLLRFIIRGDQLKHYSYIHIHIYPKTTIHSSAHFNGWSQHHHGLQANGSADFEVFVNHSKVTNFLLLSCLREENKKASPHFFNPATTSTGSKQGTREYENRNKLHQLLTISQS